MTEITMCVNCNKESQYIVENLGTNPQTFCDEHLPSFYHKNRLPHNVKLIVEEVQVVEEPVIEEVVVEKPKATKKKKSAAAVAESAE